MQYILKGEINIMNESRLLKKLNELQAFFEEKMENLQEDQEIRLLACGYYSGLSMAKDIINEKLKEKKEQWKVAVGDRYVIYCTSNNEVKIHTTGHPEVATIFTDRVAADNVASIMGGVVVPI